MLTSIEIILQNLSKTCTYKGYIHNRWCLEASFLKFLVNPLLQPNNTSSNLDHVVAFWVYSYELIKICECFERLQLHPIYPIHTEEAAETATAGRYTLSFWATRTQQPLSTIVTWYRARWTYHRVCFSYSLHNAPSRPKMWSRLMEIRRATKSFAIVL